MRNLERAAPDSLVDKFLAQLDPYRQNDVKPFMRIVRERLKLKSMQDVLDKVPGETDVVKAESVGISRNTWYAWYRGEVRPSSAQAKRLSELTGIPLQDFAGRR